MHDYKGFQVRDRFDEQVVDSVYTNDEYGVRGYRYNSHDTGGAPCTGLCIDIGAQIGTFSRLWHELHPQAKIISVEQELGLIPTLTKNVGDFARVIPAVCTYLPWTPPAGRNAITLERIMELAGERYVDVLKLDCQGFEFDILQHATIDVLKRCWLIVGEYTGWEVARRRIEAICEERLPGFTYKTEPVGQGLFILQNDYYWWRRECKA